MKTKTFETTSMAGKRFMLYSLDPGEAIIIAGVDVNEYNGFDDEEIALIDQLEIAESVELDVPTIVTRIYDED